MYWFSEMWKTVHADEKNFEIVIRMLYADEYRHHFMIWPFSSKWDTSGHLRLLPTSNSYCITDDVRYNKFNQGPETGIRYNCPSSCWSHLGWFIWVDRGKLNLIFSLLTYKMLISLPHVFYFNMWCRCRDRMVQNYKNVSEFTTTFVPVQSVHITTKVVS